MLGNPYYAFAATIYALLCVFKIYSHNLLDTAQSPGADQKGGYGGWYITIARKGERNNPRG